MEMKHNSAIDQPIFKILGNIADELGLEAYVIGGFAWKYRFIDKNG